MHIQQFNEADKASALAWLRQCCASQRWAADVLAERPFANVAALFACAVQSWQGLEEGDYLEAFTAHPKIGDLSSLHKKYASTRTQAAGEQSGMNQATPQIIAELAAHNHKYEKKFGFIFIVCASGKSASQMLDLLRARLPNTRAEELINAATEQGKITQLRLRALFGDGESYPSQTQPRV